MHQRQANMPPNGKGGATNKGGMSGPPLGRLLARLPDGRPAHPHGRELNSDTQADGFEGDELSRCATMLASDSWLCATERTRNPSF